MVTLETTYDGFVLLDIKPNFKFNALLLSV
jgi:hypothetical protein